MNTCSISLYFLAMARQQAEKYFGIATIQWLLFNNWSGFHMFIVLSLTLRSQIVIATYISLSLSLYIYIKASYKRFFLGRKFQDLF